MSNVIKGNYGYSFQEDNSRVIDTNELIASKLEMLSKIMNTQAASDEDFGEDFTQGLNATQVEQLLADPDEMSEDEEFSNGNIIKALPTQQMVAQAKAQADEILADADAQARDIIEAAQREAESIRNEAFEDGNRAGYDEGYAKGRNEGFSSLDEEKIALDQRRQQMEAEYQELLDNVEPQMVEALTEIYEHIFHVKLSANKQIVFYLLQDAVRKIENNKNFIIHVSKEDYGFVSMQKKELLAGVAGGEHTEIVEDMTLEQNECFIDTGNGIFDCSLETQLSGLKRELRLLSFSMNDGGSNP